MSSNGVVERFDLGDGQWADIRTVRLHGVERHILAIEARWLRALQTGEDAPDDDGAVILGYVLDWHVRDPMSGEPLELAQSGLDKADQDVVSRLYDRIMIIRKPAMQVVGREPNGDPLASGASLAASSAMLP